ncbi:hypothetical protein EI94DRAFT_1712774 [Lactarius quietus]|nr:hypothetical protein EI94DRAFT_1712774 [Lactarius quietus]
MSQTRTTPEARFQLMFHAALKSYEKKTKKDLIAHPLASQLQACNSTTAILVVLQDQVREFDKSRSGDERLTQWLSPTVNVLSAFSAAISGGVSLVFSPANVIFAGIGVFLLTAQGVTASKDILAELFERIGSFFTRLETYTKVAPTTAMTDIITEIMVEVLRIFGIATKEVKRGSAKKFLRKLAGMADLEDALKKLDRLTQEEARMALAEVLRITHSVRDEVKVVDGKVENVGGKVVDMGGKVADMGDKVEDVGKKVEDMGGKVADMGDKVEDVGDKVEAVGDKVEDVDNKVEDVGSKVEDVGDKVDNLGDKVECVDKRVQVVIDGGKQARVAATEAKLILQQTANDIDEIKWNQLKQLLRAWLSPTDPSTNHNIARKAQHRGTAVWFFQGSIFVEWKSTGSLLWIHGKPGSGKSIICSSVIQDIMNICEAGSAVMAYFYFDFRDLNKKSCRDLLLSLVFQLSTRSRLCCDVLHHVYQIHETGTRQPSDETLKECLKEMLRLLVQGPIFIILDALDECPDSSGIPSPRHEVLQLVKELVELHLPELHICATSRPEVNIRTVIEPLAFRSVSLHDESGQKKDIADYVRSVVHSSPSTAMRRWRAADKNLIIETVTERADGMFRWVFCQLDTLQHCFPPNLRQFLDELPETLDETYERMLTSINKAQWGDAHRLLQCLVVAVRPLRVEELAELLAFDFQASRSGGIPNLKEDWRWDDEEEAVLSTCSSLITIVPDGDSRVVQFSHFSVKEYLTSARLARSPRGDVLRFYIDLEPAHMIMVQACLGTLLQLDEQVGNSDAKESPLVKYAAQYWSDHARFENVSSHVCDGMDDLFDTSKPYFAAWLRVHDMDIAWVSFPKRPSDSAGSSLYYAAFCGLYGLAERLIMKHPEQINAHDSQARNLAPILAALYKRHFHVANLLFKHDAFVDLRGSLGWTLLHDSSLKGHIDIVRWLLNHGADANAHTNGGSSFIPLHLVTRGAAMEVEVVQVLLEHNADINSQSAAGETPLYYTVSGIPSEQRVKIVRRLLERGANPNICTHRRSTPLHQASSRGWLEAAQLLLSYGAKVDEKDKEGKTPFQVASEKGHHDITKLLLEHGAILQQ